MPARLIQLLAGVAAGLAAALVWLALVSAPPAALAAPAAHTFSVNSAADVPDAAPGDGVCETAPGNHICTLRGAIQEANHLPGADTIQLQANTTYLLSRGGAADDSALNGDLDITDSVSLVGAGPGSSLIDAGALTPTERVLDIFPGTVVISGVSVQHGQSINFGGGGIRNRAQLTLINTSVFSNSVGGSVNESGGGIFNAGWLTLTRSLVAGNATGNSDAAGGGIYNDAFLYVRDSTIRANATYSGTNGAGFGGGVQSKFKATFVNSTLSDNYAAAGGGLRVEASSAVLINTTVSGNTSGGRGSGIDCIQCVQLQLFNTTLTGNLANNNLFGGFGGVAISGGTLTLNNSLLAYNLTKTAHTLPDDNCYIGPYPATINAFGGNIITRIDAAHCVVAGAPANDDPLLGPLQDNGGPTATHALLPGSPAIDAGTLSGCTDDLGAPIPTDQRGFPRAANITGVTRCDLGAYEAQRTLALPLVRK